MTYPLIWLGKLSLQIKAKLRIAVSKKLFITYMDATVKEAGIKYERLLLRAYSYKYKQGVSHPSANRRIYYLIYYIRIGYDLRKTGYGAQFNLIRESIIEALNLFLNFRLRSDEKDIMETLLSKAKTAMNEKDLNEVLTEALSATERFQII